jgi:hypothetical protein
MYLVRRKLFMYDNFYCKLSGLRFIEIRSIASENMGMDKQSRLPCYAYILCIWA